MRNAIIVLFISLQVGFYSAPVDAYVIHNNTGIAALFLGEFCAPCFKGEIANRDTAACPGNERGCKNTTYVSLSLSGSKADYFGVASTACYLATPVAVTARGDVYAYRDYVIVRDDNGKALYNGPWRVSSCGGGHIIF